MTPLKIPQLATHEWKPCNICDGSKVVWENEDGNEVYNECHHCQGHGVEPVDVVNPECEECNREPPKRENCSIFCEDGCSNCETEHDYTPCTGYKLQVGVAFEIECEMCNATGTHPDPAYLDHDMTCIKCLGRMTLKFLPLYPQVEGDNSVLMVVRCG